MMESDRDIQSPGRYHIADLIGQLQRREKPLKETIEKCDVLFSKQNLDTFTRELCKQEVQKQQKYFQEYLEAFRALDQKTQKPYANLYEISQKKIRKYKLKTDRHKKLRQEMEADPDTHRKYIDSQRQIWEEEFQNQARVISIGRGIIGIFGAMLLHLIIGACYRWSMINTFMSSYFKLTNDPYISIAQDSFGTPLYIFSVGLTMKPALKLSEKTGKLILIPFAVIMVAVSILIASMMPSFLLFLLFHNFFFGMSAGFLFLTTMSECQKYFSQHRLYVNSAILVGTGLGAVFFGQMNISCMNPDSLSPSASGFYSGQLDVVAYMLPHCLRQMAIVVLAIGFLGWILMVPLFRYNSNEIVVEHRIRLMRSFQFICRDQNQALKSPIFWKIAGMVVLASMGNFFTTMNYKNIPSGHIHNMQFLSLVVMCGGIANGLFRAVWGYSLQRFGFKWCFVVAMGLNCICFGLIPLAVKEYYTYMVVYTIICAVTGGLMVLIPNLCLLVFGDLVGNEIFGYIWMCFTSANFIQYLIGANFGSQIQHAYLILIFLFTSAMALIVVSLVKFQGRWQNSLDKLTF